MTRSRGCRGARHADRSSRCEDAIARIRMQLSSFPCSPDERPRHASRAAGKATRVRAVPLYWNCSAGSKTQKVRGHVRAHVHENVTRRCAVHAQSIASGCRIELCLSSGHGFCTAGDRDRTSKTHIPGSCGREPGAYHCAAARAREPYDRAPGLARGKRGRQPGSIDGSRAVTQGCRRVQHGAGGSARRSARFLRSRRAHDHGERRAQAALEIAAGGRPRRCRHHHAPDPARPRTVRHL